MSIGHPTGRWPDGNRLGEVSGKDRREGRVSRTVNRPSLTRRQREALEWIARVGKASPKLIRRHGFQQRTLDALADAGLVKREYIPRVVGGMFPVYRAVRDA